MFDKVFIDEKFKGCFLFLNENESEDISNQIINLN